MKTIAKNFAWNLIYQVLTALFPLILAPYLARILGAGQIGAYSFAQSIVSCFVLVAVAGTSLYGQRSIARASAQKESRKQIFLELLILRTVGAVVAFAVYYQFVYKNVENATLYLIAAIDILSVIFDISWFYQGMERFGRITVCNIIGKTLAAVGIFTLVKSPEDLNTYVLIYCGTTLISNMIQWVFLPAELKGEGKHRVYPVRHIKPVLVLFTTQIAMQAYTVLDKTMIGLITKSDYESGYYDQAQKLIKTLVAVVTSMGAVMTSRIAAIWYSDEQRKKEQVEELLVFSFRLVFAIGLPVVAGINAIAPRFVSVFFGAGYDPVAPLIRVLAWLIPIIGCSNIIGMQWFVPSGREQLVTKSVIVGAIINVLLNLCLINRLGAMGAVISSVVAEMAVTGTQFFLAHKELPMRKIVRSLIRYGCFSVVVWILGSVLTANLPNGVGAVIGIVVSCIGVYLGLLLLTKDTLLRELFNRYKN